MLSTSSAITADLADWAGPNLVEIATSVASRPREITIVAGIEDKPSSDQVRLEPDAEIHRCRIDGNAIIAEIPGAIARGIFMQRHNVTAKCAKSGQTPTGAPRKPCGRSGHDGTRTRYAHEHSRRSLARAPIPPGLIRTSTMQVGELFRIAIGCQEDRREHRPANLQAGAGGPRAQRVQVGRCQKSEIYSLF